MAIQQVLVRFGFSPVAVKVFSDGLVEQTWARKQQDFFLQTKLRYKEGTPQASLKVHRIKTQRLVPGVNFETVIHSEDELKNEISSALLKLRMVRTCDDVTTI